MSDKMCGGKYKEFMRVFSNLLPQLSEKEQNELLDWGESQLSSKKEAEKNATDLTAGTYNRKNASRLSKGR